MTQPTRRPTSTTGATTPPGPITGEAGHDPGRSTSVTGTEALTPILDGLAAGAARLGIADGTAIVLAVSGGPDSTALLHGAAALAPDRGWRLTVAHLDHALRPTSADEAATVAASAARLRLPVWILPAACF